jgi:hypothetical protein
MHRGIISILSAMGCRLDEIARERELSGMTAPPIINGGWFQAVINRVRKSSIRK